jgi:hypothetical protein
MNTTDTPVTSSLDDALFLSITEVTPL